MPSAPVRRQVQPTWCNHPIYVDTFGPQVCDIATLAGFAPYPEQEQALDLLFAIGPNGKSVAFEFDLIAPRQVMKTGFIMQAELGWLFVTGEKLIVHSAHELSTTEEAFNDLAALIERTPALSSRLKPTRGERPGIVEGNGRWSIHTKDGQRVKYKARTKGGGRGLTGWKVVLDEGFALLPSHMGALLPTLTSVPDPQVLIASSAGKLESAVLRDARERGRAGSDPTQVYIEYGDKAAWTGCADAECVHAKNAIGCALDDVDRWGQIIPGLHSRISVSTIQSMRRSMPPEEFLREFMVWWEDPPEGTGVPAAIDPTAWPDLKDTKTPAPQRAAITIDVSPNRKSAALGVAGDGAPGRTMVMVRHSTGIGWVVPELQRLREKNEIAEVALHPGQAAVLAPELTAADIPFRLLTRAEAGQSCALWQEAAADGSLSHANQASLNAAVGNAYTRISGEGEFWDRRSPDIDISPVVAASEALWLWRSQKPARLPLATFI